MHTIFNIFFFRGTIFNINLTNFINAQSYHDGHFISTEFLWGGSQESKVKFIKFGKSNVKEKKIFQITHKNIVIILFTLFYFIFGFKEKEK